ncbi:MAG: hypothetical protein R3C24_15975 [Cyanobacteriota/Melainabacteria group bacterium]
MPITSWEKDKALSDLENGVQLPPNDAMAHYKLAHVLLDSGETQKLLKSWMKRLKSTAVSMPVSSIEPKQI